MVDSLQDNPILGLLDNKAHFLKKVLTCSQMLTDLTYENHENEYKNLLETRERSIEALNSIETALQVELQGKASIKDDQAVAALVAETKMLIQQILILDERNKAAISAELQKLKMQISTLTCGRKGINGYEASQRMNFAGVYTDSRK
jgi:hypothetical protein